MKPHLLGLRVSGTIFGLMCLAQLARVATQAEVLIAGHLIPVWVSGIACVIAGSLSLWLWKLSRSAGV